VSASTVHRPSTFTWSGTPPGRESGPRAGARQTFGSSCCTPPPPVDRRHGRPGAFFCAGEVSRGSDVHVHVRCVWS
jgi:hypothetical protein